MILKILGVDPSFCNFGMVSVELNTTDNSFKVIKMHIAQTEEEKESRTKVVRVNGVAKLKTVKARPKDIRKNQDDFRRCIELFSQFQEHVQDVDLVIAELPHGSQDARAMTSYGICLAVLASSPVPVIKMSASEVKMIATGNNDATKHEMIEAAIKLQPDAPWLTRKLKGEIVLKADNEHLADAMFSIVAGLNTDEFKRYLNTCYGEAS